MYTKDQATGVKEAWAYAGDGDGPGDWDHCYEKLARTIEQARAISAAHHALVYLWIEGEQQTGVPDHSEALADAGVRLCDEALKLATVLRQCVGRARDDADNLALAREVEAAKEAERGTCGEG